MRLAFAFIVTTAALLPACDSKPHDEAWALPDYMFQDNSNTSTLSVTGTLKGKDIGNPVNTWSIYCPPTHDTCRVANVAEIGNRQLGEIFMADWTVKDWTDSAVVLDEGDPTSCAHSVIILNRVAETVSYTSTPQNQDRNYCQGYNKFAGPPASQNWEIGKPVQPWERKPRADSRP